VKNYYFCSLLYSETSIYHSRIIRFPGSIVQFLWSLSESYFNYGSRIYCFRGTIISFSDPRRKRWIEVSLYMLFSLFHIKCGRSISRFISASHACVACTSHSRCQWLACPSLWPLCLNWLTMRFNFFSLLQQVQVIRAWYLFLSWGCLKSRIMGNKTGDTCNLWSFMSSTTAVCFSKTYKDVTILHLLKPASDSIYSKFSNLTDSKNINEYDFENCSSIMRAIISFPHVLNVSNLDYIWSDGSPAKKK
jgi:hypothetical protein